MPTRPGIPKAWVDIDTALTANSDSRIATQKATKAYIDGRAVAEIHAATSKTPPVDADEFGIWDSVSTALRKVTWANIKATLSTLFAPDFVTYTGTCTAKDVVYMTAAGTIAAAKSDSSTTMPVVGFATETKVAAACIIQIGGTINIPGKTFTPGLAVYASDTVAGDCTQTPPTTDGYPAQVVGIAMSAEDVKITLLSVVEVNTGVVDVAAGKTLTVSKTMQLTGADDTTVALMPAGSTTIVGTAATQTLTNKRITPRVALLPADDATITVGETPGYNTDTADMFYINGLTLATLFGAPGGTPTDGQKIMFRILDDGNGPWGLTWNAVFVNRGATIPSTTADGKYTYVGFMYNSIATTWDCIATVTEA